jgi:hypothetical protein
MAKRRIQNKPEVELSTLKSEIITLNKRMEEVITILGGNASYRVKGILFEFSETQKDIVEIKKAIEEIKQQEKDRWSIPLKTVPQKIFAVITSLAVLLSMFQSVKSLLTQP